MVSTKRLLVAIYFGLLAFFATGVMIGMDLTAMIYQKEKFNQLKFTLAVLVAVALTIALSANIYRLYKIAKAK